MISVCRCRAATMRSTPRRRSRSRTISAWRPMPSARRWPASAASSGASPAPANGMASTIFDDYGHHPVEIAAVLKAARASTRARSSPSCSRIAIRDCKSVQRVLGLLQRCGRGRSSPTSMPPARRRSKGRIATASSLASRRGGIATSSRWTGPGRSPASSPRWRGPATMSSFSAPETSPNGPMRCRKTWRLWGRRTCSGSRQNCVYPFDRLAFCSGMK